MNRHIEEDDIFGDVKDTVEAEIEHAKLDYAIALEKLRRALNISYKEVARQYGKSAGYISRVFRGDENVTVGTMVKLAKVLNGRVSISVTDRSAALGWPYLERRRRELSNQTISQGIVVSLPAQNITANPIYITVCEGEYGIIENLSLNTFTSRPDAVPKRRRPARHASIS